MVVRDKCARHAPEAHGVPPPVPPRRGRLLRARDRGIMGGDVDRETFADRFRRAAEWSREFGQTFVLEELPDDLLFRVRLNSSYDRNPLREGEVVFPEDGSYERAVGVRLCDAAAVVDVLWRDGRVPEWINLSPIGCTESATILEVVSCGRFTDDERLLYHQDAGLPPFHVLGPNLPPEYDRPNRAKFSVHRKFECWDRQDLERLHLVHDKVWSLTLYTDEFDRDALRELPELPAMEILEHRRCSTNSDPIDAVARFQGLRNLRVRLTEAARLALGKESEMPTLESFAIENLPADDWGFACLAKSAPRLGHVELHAASALRLDGAFGRNVTSVYLTAERIEGRLRLPARLDSLVLCFRDIDDEGLQRLFSGVKRVNALHLRETPTSDELALTLPSRFGLEFLDLVGTGVSRETVELIARRSSDLRLLPNYNATVIRGN
jgi:hypothetical protein